jgi:hypothetical protein
VALLKFLLPLLSGLLLALPPAAAQPSLGAIVLKPLRIELPAGEARSVEVDLGDALAGGFLYKAELPEMEISRDAVTLGFVELRESKSRRDGTPLEGERVALARRGSPLGIRVVAGQCCTGVQRRLVELLPPPGSRTSKGPAWPVRLPVEIVVRPDEWACRRSWLPLAAGLVGGLLGIYILGMKEQSHFLIRQELARRLDALRLDKTGGAQTSKAGDMLRLVKQELTFWRRAWNWLKANPLIIGLPGRAYYETVELHLEPGRNLHRSRLILCPARELHQDKDLKRIEGKLFASAFKRLSLFTVPAARGRVGRFVLDRPVDVSPRILWLRKDERLHLEETEGASEWRNRR